jgi:probable HAF family extracellular repeat protein
VSLAKVQQHMNIRRSVMTLLCGLIVMVGLSGPAQAALIDRGGGFIYDTDLDITWTQDAALSGFDNWDDQVAWVDALSLVDSVRNVTWDDWRLASMSVAGGVPTGSAASVVDCSTATELACRDNELAYMFYHNLGGTVGDDLTGNQGLIQNIQQDYWSGTEEDARSAWVTIFNGGGPFAPLKSNIFVFAWAVRDGDVGQSSIPEPSTFQGLGDLAGGDFESLAHGISPDGSVVVGHSQSTSGLEAFKWTESTGMVGLGDLSGGNFSSSARASSTNGTVIV